MTLETPSGGVVQCGIVAQNVQPWACITQDSPEIVDSINFYVKGLALLIMEARQSQTQQGRSTGQRLEMSWSFSQCSPGIHSFFSVRDELFLAKLSVDWMSLISSTIGRIICFTQNLHICINLLLKWRVSRKLLQK